MPKSKCCLRDDSLDLFGRREGILTLLIHSSIKYNHSFEHSLVEELGYVGFQKLRKAFDKAFGGEENVPMFDLVVDAGCGTGLVGEQVRIKS